VVLTYDPTAKKYFRALSSATALSATLQPASTIVVAADKSTEVAAPENYRLAFVAVPSGKASVVLATSVSKSVTKAWGTATTIRVTGTGSGG
jgi:hypothetical protein